MRAALDSFGNPELRDGFSAEGYRVWADVDLRLEWFAEGERVKTTRVRIPPDWVQRLEELSSETGDSLPTLVRSSLMASYGLSPVERYPAGKEGSQGWYELPPWVREARKQAYEKRQAARKGRA